MVIFGLCLVHAGQQHFVRLNDGIDGGFFLGLDFLLSSALALLVLLHERGYRGHRARRAATRFAFFVGGRRWTQSRRKRERVVGGVSWARSRAARGIRAQRAAFSPVKNYEERKKEGEEGAQQGEGAEDRKQTEVKTETEEMNLLLFYSYIFTHSLSHAASP